MSVSGVSIGVGRGNEHPVIGIEVILGIEQPRGHRIVGVDNVLTREGKAEEKRRSLGIPYGMCLTTTVPPSGFHEQGLSVRP